MFDHRRLGVVGGDICCRCVGRRIRGVVVVMKWQHPRVGDRRVVSKFLWLPTTIDNETRWLEYATIVEVYEPWYDGITGGWRWIPEKWGDE